MAKHMATRLAARMAEWRELQRRYAMFLAPAVAKRLSARDPSGKRAHAFEAGEPDPVRRAGMCLAMAYCHNGSWAGHRGLDTLIMEWVLPDIEPKHVAEAARLAIAAPDRAAAMLHGPLAAVFPGMTREQIAEGFWAAKEYPPGVVAAARWLFLQEGWRALEARVLDDVVPRLAEAGMSHPEFYNRRSTLRGLRAMNCPVAVAALRRCFEGRIAGRPRPKPGLPRAFDLIDEHHAGRDFHPRCSDPTVAGYLLADMGERDILPELLRRLAGAALADRELLAKAIDKLVGRRGE